MPPLASTSTVNPKVKAILAELRRRLEELYGDRLVKMILYGSHARGDARQYSDIDVLVVLKGPVWPSQEVRRTGGIVAGLSLEHDEVIQCLFMDDGRYTRDDTPLLGNVSREGVEV
ncbi:MAG: nucleotidyltransferase domain-containing protein [Acidobacteriota bacterium]